MKFLLRVMKDRLIARQLSDGDFLSGVTSQVPLRREGIANISRSSVKFSLQVNTKQRLPCDRLWHLVGLQTLLPSISGVRLIKWTLWLLDESVSSHCRYFYWSGTNAAPHVSTIKSGTSKPLNSHKTKIKKSHNLFFPLNFNKIRSIHLVILYYSCKSNPRHILIIVLSHSQPPVFFPHDSYRHHLPQSPLCHPAVVLKHWHDPCKGHLHTSPAERRHIFVEYYKWQPQKCQQILCTELPFLAEQIFSCTRVEEREHPCWWNDIDPCEEIHSLYKKKKKKGGRRSGSAGDQCSSGDKNSSWCAGTKHVRRQATKYFKPTDIGRVKPNDANSDPSWNLFYTFPKPGRWHTDIK